MLILEHSPCLTGIAKADILKLTKTEVRGLEIRVLRYFLAVAREQSISRAAEFLHITQPTLSRQLMALEEELGVLLFERGRNSRRVVLTDDGMLLRRRAEEIVELSDKTEAEFQQRDDVVSGDIYIGAGETDAMRYIARAAKALQNAYPNIRYHLYSGNADDVAERLDKGILDFGVMLEPAPIDKYDYIQFPISDVWGILMRKDDPLAQKQSITPEDVPGLPLIVSRQSMVTNMLSGWSGADFVKLNIVGTYNLIFNAALMVEEGFGCALCLDKLAKTDESSTLCFRPLEPRLEAHLDVVWKKYQVFTRAAELFLGSIQSVFKQD